MIEKRNGIVVSDLHLFTKRSVFDSLSDQFYRALEQSKILVLNGDIFDFRWANQPDTNKMIAAAVNWLNLLLSGYPHLNVHFIPGNHDCYYQFTEALNVLAAESERFKWHSIYLRLGSNLFLHGDCANRTMTAFQFKQYRKTWQHIEKRNFIASTFYSLADLVGIPLAIHYICFPQQMTVKRIIAFLKDKNPDLLNKIEHIYFGHTHIPFNSYHAFGYIFHNTGSAINGMRFNMLQF